MSSDRINFIVDRSNRLLIIRPIGALSDHILAERTIDAFRRLDEPWKYNRIVDLRRFEGYMSDNVRESIATVWAEITAGVSYRAYVAMLMHDAFDALRLPQIRKSFPNETFCVFSDYHEAVGWLLADDKEQYLSALGPGAGNR